MCTLPYGIKQIFLIFTVPTKVPVPFYFSLIYSGGNVLTSQRLVDVVLLAFQACAASQGCCNNITFGNFKYAAC
jgi:hypothetical protein